jgi:hypothetical protein
VLLCEKAGLVKLGHVAIEGEQDEGQRRDPCGWVFVSGVEHQQAQSNEFFASIRHFNNESIDRLYRMRTHILREPEPEKRKPSTHTPSVADFSCLDPKNCRLSVSHRLTALFWAHKEPRG